MTVSIVICTLNRAESLRRTLASLVAMRAPGELDWEVLVVNNNCTDDTDSVIEAYRGLLPLRREFEPQRGHCNARNRAIDAARGDYFVWTDDDVLVDSDWLSAYADAFRNWPEAAVFGGPIIPKFEPPTPKWLADCLDQVGGAFAARDLGDCVQPLAVEGNRIPYGANFAVRAIQQRNFRYNPELGLGAGRGRLGDEVDVITRILQSGGVGYWIPEAKVEHCIGRERQTVEYLFRHFTAWGETRAFLVPPETAARLWLGVPRWRWRQLFEQWMRYRFHRLASPARVWMCHFQAYGFYRGKIRYLRSVRR
jgi:glucosyl-dolichyl phosphate glucuronosyltransferase